MGTATTLTWIIFLSACNRGILNFWRGRSRIILSGRFWKPHRWNSDIVVLHHRHKRSVSFVIVSLMQCLFLASSLESIVYRHGPRLWPLVGVYSGRPSVFPSWPLQGFNCGNLCWSSCWVCIGTSAEPVGTGMAGEGLQTCKTHSTNETKNERRSE